MNPVADTLFKYLYDVIYNPAQAELDVDALPEDFQEFGAGLKVFTEHVLETKALAFALSQGNLHCEIPHRSNELAAPLKALHASLKHMTWQTQQVSKGDYSQRMIFLGEFAEAFNKMAEQLEERSILETKERSRLQHYINLILANTPDMLLVFDTSGKAVLASQAYIQNSLFLTAGEIRGKTFEELFEPVAAEDFLCDIIELTRYAIEDKCTYDIEQSVDISGSDSPRTYNIHVAPMLYEGDVVIGTMIVFHDMTDIAQARQEAEHARVLAEQSAKAKSDFLARMSHEMRTPMNAIIGMTYIGEKAECSEKKDYALKKIERASKHLLGVINDVLDISKIEADKLELSNSEFNLHDMLINTYNLISTRVAEKKQHFTINIGDDVPTNVVSDEQHMAQVLMNLLSNAAKFTPEEGTISLCVDIIRDGSNAGLLREARNEAGEQCEIRFMVKDSGIGMTEEQLSHLFVPFEQADGSISRKFGGTGLGLAISKSIAEKLGGSITVDTQPDNGSTFIFTAVVEKSGNDRHTEKWYQNGTIPGEKKNKISDTICHSEQSEESFNPDFRGHCILLAEDVDINREILISMLEPTLLEIDCAENGREAVHMYCDEPDRYSLIFMDVQMPEMDGLEATRTIRSLSLQQAKEIPIIAMTANVFREDIDKCLEAGMNAHIGKPIDIAEVMEALRKWIV